MSQNESDKTQRPAGSAGRKNNHHNRHRGHHGHARPGQPAKEPLTGAPDVAAEAAAPGEAPPVDLPSREDARDYLPALALQEEESSYSLTVDLADDATLLTDDPLPLPDDTSPKVEVVGVRFKKSGKVYYFAPGNLKVSAADAVIVETARGHEFGEIACPNRMVSERDIVPPLRPLVRLATKDDIRRSEDNERKEREAFAICLKKIEEHKLDMKLVEAEYTFDNSKLLFYFTSAGRIDFRDLVKDLASVFRTRIELRQIGIRDEAKLMGGLGVCGRPLCCACFLSDFAQVSIKMAKEQNLSLNSTKISGSCGRLMCCLRYEHETYEAELKLSPPVDALVKTEDGVGVVTEVNPIAGLVKVKITDKADVPPKFYPRGAVTVLKASRKAPDPVGSATEEPDASN